MNGDSQERLRLAIREIVRPIVHFLLEAGIGVKEFSQIAKEEFVHLASLSYGVRGRPTNISRVAVMTGLTRKEIKTIREAGALTGDESARDMERINPATVLLHAWHSDPSFTNDAGVPMPLEKTGDGATFDALCKNYAGDIPAGAMLAELRRAGSIQENSDGTIEPKSRYYTPRVFDDRFVGSMAFSIANLARTLMTNAVYSRRTESNDLKELGLMERYVWTSRLSKKDSEEFKRFAEEKTTKLLAELDAWIGAREHKGSKARRDSPADTIPTDPDLVGLGVYLFENNSRPKP